MKKFLKWTGIVLLVLVALAFIAGWIASEPLPAGTAGPEAEALAEKMQAATAQAAWDSTHYISWDFGSGRHQLLWDRQRKLVQVSWSDNKVLLNTQSLDGLAWEDSQQLEGSAARKKLDEAWAIFCNDSFWLNAPGKVFDPGTARKLVELENGEQGLLVTYSSGGVTPGDSYLWILDDAGRPVRWKMWVNIIPIGGISSSWENWQELPTGAMVATHHKMGFYDLVLSDIKAGDSWRQIGLQADPFTAMH